MKNQIAILSSAVVLSLLSGCTIALRTPAPPHVQGLDALDAKTATLDAVQIALGAPQSVGIHRVGDEDLPLLFYSSMQGVMNAFTGGAHLDSVMAFVSFDHKNRVRTLLGFTSKFDGPQIRQGHAPSVAQITKLVRIGETRADAIIAELGDPPYRGTRFDLATDLSHEMLFYDGSKIGSGTLTERWFMLGYDSSGIVQDLLWVSSLAEDLTELGEVQQQQMRNLTRVDMDGPFVWTMVEGTATSTRIDPVQIDALLRTKPKTLAEFTKVLGPPTARGFKAFAGQDTVELSNWSHMTTKMLGNESGPSMRSQSQPDEAPIQSSYAVIELKQTRLIVAHTRSGEVCEIFWVRPDTGGSTL